MKDVQMCEPENRHWLGSILWTDCISYTYLFFYQLFLITSCLFPTTFWHKTKKKNTVAFNISVLHAYTLLCIPHWRIREKKTFSCRCKQKCAVDLAHCHFPLLLTHTNCLHTRPWYRPKHFRIQGLSIMYCLPLGLSNVSTGKVRNSLQAFPRCLFIKWNMFT